MKRQKFTIKDYLNQMSDKTSTRFNTYGNSIENQLQKLDSGIEKKLIGPAPPPIRGFEDYDTPEEALMYDRYNNKHNKYEAGRNAALAAAGTAGVVGAGMSLKNILRKHSWKKNGCDNIEDLNKKQECLNYVNTLRNKDLQSALSKCQDEPCRKAIQSQMK